ncbi:MAG TPA: c-type cytochrome biogenesis protein CcmI, partial [Gammaproteobacteria bacterium]|nr:c-type cytochrome biogenesis protein CcmI [Gammaproteobacteria bacterium]
MSVFWMIVGTLLTSVIVAMLPVLLRSRPISRQTTSNLTLHDLRLAELHRDVDEQSMDASALAEAKDEIARALLEESVPDSDTDDAKNAPAGRWLVTIIVLVAIPTISLSTYLSLGSPQLATGVAKMGTGVDHKTISAMVTQLERRLEDNPDSAEGWLLLGRTYMA